MRAQCRWDMEACLVLCSGFGRFWVWAQPWYCHACQYREPLFGFSSSLASDVMAITMSMQSFPGDAIFCGGRDRNKVEAPRGTLSGQHYCSGRLSRWDTFMKHS